MREDLMSFIWKFGFYAKEALRTVHGETVIVESPGKLNRFDGPDFEEAAIRIGGIIWYGAVELHTYSSDWYRHGHDTDPGYDQVILHLCWQVDTEVLTSSGRTPVHLQLSDYVDAQLKAALKDMFKNSTGLVCKDSLFLLDDIYFYQWIDRMSINRIIERADEFFALVRECGWDWRKASLVRAARILGKPGNDQLMQDFVFRLDVRWLFRKRDNLFALIALLLGEAGLLQGHSTESYENRIKAEYKHRKIGWSDESIELRWKKAGIRSGGSISNRLVSLACFIHVIGDLEMSSLEEDWDNKMKLLQLKIPTYWKWHRAIGVLSKNQVPYFTPFVTRNLRMNLIYPYFVARSKFGDSYTDAHVVQSLLEREKSEENKITSLFKIAGKPPENGAQSQGMIELYNQLCQHKKCVNCGIGYKLIKSRVST